MNPHALSALINDLGILTTASRAAASRQYVMGMLAPIVAAALNYHHVTTTRLASQTGH